MIPEEQLVPEGPPPPRQGRGRGRGLTRFGSLRPLRHRDFGLLWSAALVSNIGTWVQTVAVGALVTEMTGQARWTGLVAAAGFLPVGLLSPVGGVLADRVDRRLVLRLTTVGETLFASMLAILTATGHATPLNVSLVVLGGGCMAALGFPSYQAALPDLVPREELLGAMSLSMTQYNLGRVVGPAIAGLVLVVGSYSFAFVANALSFGAVLVALSLVRLPRPVATGEEGGLWRRIATGARAAWSEPGCRTAILTIGVTALLLSPFIALIPAVAINLFDKGEGGTSVLITAQGVGAVAGALALTWVAARFGRPRALLVNLVVLPALLVLYAIAPSLPVAALALAAVGAAYIGILSGLATVVQLRAPSAVRGRILSLYMVALGTIYPIGAVIQGALGDRFGLRTVTAGCAVAFTLVVVVVRLTRPELMGVLDDPRGDEAGVGRRLGLASAGVWGWRLGLASRADPTGSVTVAAASTGAERGETVAGRRHRRPAGGHGQPVPAVAVPTGHRISHDAVAVDEEDRRHGGQPVGARHPVRGRLGECGDVLAVAPLGRRPASVPGPRRWRPPWLPPGPSLPPWAPPSGTPGRWT